MISGPVGSPLFLIVTFTLNLTVSISLSVLYLSPSTVPLNFFIAASSGSPATAMALRTKLAPIMICWTELEMLQEEDFREDLEAAEIKMMKDFKNNQQQVSGPAAGLAPDRRAQPALSKDPKLQEDNTELMDVSKNIQAGAKAKRMPQEEDGATSNPPGTQHQVSGPATGLAPGRRAKPAISKDSKLQLVEAPKNIQAGAKAKRIIREDDGETPNTLGTQQQVHGPAAGLAPDRRAQPALSKDSKLQEDRNNLEDNYLNEVYYAMMIETGEEAEDSPPTLDEKQKTPTPKTPTPTKKSSSPTPPPMKKRKVRTIAPK